MTSPPASRHPVSRRPALLRAAAAVSCALLLLTGGAVTHARWHQEQPLPGGILRTGQLGVDLGAPQILLTRTDLVPGATTTARTQRTTTEITATAGSRPLIAGDEVVVRLPMTIAAEGNNLTATLRVDPGTLSGTPALVAAFDAGRTSVAVQPVGGTPRLVPVAGQTRTWTVTRASHGASYIVEITYTLRGTRDGATRADATTANWWGPELQGAVIGPRRVTATLTQN